jgi:UrcA family protein
MYRFATTTLICTLALSSQLTQAAPPPDVHSIDVPFADLDLTRSEGAAVLYQRIRAAAKRVCASLDARDLASQMRFRGCVETAMGSAVAKVDRPALTAYYRAQFKGRNATFQIAQN